MLSRGRSQRIGNNIQSQTDIRNKILKSNHLFSIHVGGRDFDILIL